MAASQGFRELLIDMLAPLGHVEVRSMFGGAGVYCDRLMFGLIADDTLFLKADAATATEFEAEGQPQFVYTGKDKRIAMSYWRAPERLFDDPDDMLKWAGKALDVARRAAARKSKPARKSPQRQASRAGGGIVPTEADAAEPRRNRRGRPKLVR